MLAKIQDEELAKVDIKDQARLDALELGLAV